MQEMVDVQRVMRKMVHSAVEQLGSKVAKINFIHDHFLVDKDGKLTIELPSKINFYADVSGEQGENLYANCQLHVDDNVGTIAVYDLNKNTKLHWLAYYNDQAEKITLFPQSY